MSVIATSRYRMISRTNALLQEPRGGVVGEDLAVGLAGRAVAHGVAAVFDRAHHVAAHRAGLVRAAVDGTGSVFRGTHVGARALVREPLADRRVDRVDHLR